MSKVDLKLYSTDAREGKKQTTSITYVNPNASNDVLKTFAQKLNNFTSNNYTSADRVETVNVDTETRKTNRNIEVTGTRNSQATMTINATQNESLNPFVAFSGGGTLQRLDVTQQGYENSTLKFTFNIPNQSGNLLIGTRETDDFYSEYIVKSF